MVSFFLKYITVLQKLKSGESFQNVIERAAPLITSGKQYDKNRLYKLEVMVIASTMKIVAAYEELGRF